MQKERGRERKRGREERRKRKKESNYHPKARKLSLSIYKVSNKGALFLVMKISSFCCKSKITEDLKTDLMPHKIINVLFQTSTEHTQQTPSNRPS